MRRTKRWALLAVVGVIAPLMAGCGKDAGDGGVSIVAPPPAPRFPSVAGNWRGSFRVTGFQSQPVTLSLQQRDDAVSGTLTVGTDSNTINGAIDAFGVLQFEGRDTSSGGCTRYLTAGDHLALGAQGGVANSRLSGTLVRIYPRLNCSGSFLTQTGNLSVEKIL